MAQLRVSFHLSQLPFLSQLAVRFIFFTVQFQSVKYAIQSFISCQDGILYKHRHLIASNDLWEKGSVFVYWLEKVCIHTCSHSDTGLLEQTDMDPFLASGVPPKSNAFNACDLSLLNSLNDKRHARNSFTPSFPLPLHPSASRIHRRLISDQKAALQSSQYCEPSCWSYILSSFSLKLYCVLLYWFCVWAGHVLFPNQWKVYVGCPLWVAHSVCCI